MIIWKEGLINLSEHQFYQMVSAFSVPKAQRSQKYNANPGPGNYNPQTSPKAVKPSDPRYSFGKDSRRQLINKVPGPGSYEEKQSFTKHKNPSYSLGARKEEHLGPGVVGPGAYEPTDRYSKQKAPQYSMMGRSSSELKGNKLGPGDYDIKGEIQSKRIGYHFSKDRRENIDKRNVPGPGSYEFENAVFKYGSKQDPSYGFGSRLQDPSKLNAPGPGAYQSKGIYSKIGGIMSRQMRNSYAESKTPGPGNYEPDGSRVKNRDPSWSMPKSSRDYMSKSTVVGPGAYEHDKNYKELVTLNKGYNFGSQTKLKYDISNVPGPGEYNGQMLKSRRNVKIGQKIKDPSSSYVPGPGSYQSEKYDYQSWMKGGGKYSVGKGGRDGINGLNVPGPGTYDQELSSSRLGKVTFSKDTRLKGVKSEVPGPGQYDLKPTFADVPSYLLPSKS